MNQEGDIIEIGPDIRLMIQRVNGGWVKVAIDAPREIAIRRVPGEDPEPDGETAAVERSVEVLVRRRRPGR
jgi:hypothetical protein